VFVSIVPACTEISRPLSPLTIPRIARALPPRKAKTAGAKISRPCSGSVPGKMDCRVSKDTACTRNCFFFFFTTINNYWIAPSQGTGGTLPVIKESTLKNDTARESVNNFHMLESVSTQKFRNILSCILLLARMLDVISMYSVFGKQSYMFSIQQQRSIMPLRILHLAATLDNVSLCFFFQQ
jgi:hypothetical protein